MIGAMNDFFIGSTQNALQHAF